ncbi:hypothetical protein DFH09DRAFT_1271514 [Mycena vulgaris]|nr:hypothetical protein DFH09DRAFT_1271514 [Mycena vulgaris]
MRILHSDVPQYIGNTSSAVYEDLPRTAHVNIPGLAHSGTVLSFSPAEPLQCPKCDKIFPKGSNKTSLSQHVDGNKCKRAVAARSSQRNAPASRVDSASVPIPLLHPPAPTIQSLPAYGPCPGLRIEWDEDDFWESYPMKMHKSSSLKRPNYDFISLDPPQIRSKRCQGASLIPGLACPVCADLNLDISVVRERAGRNFEQIRSEDDLSWKQLREKLDATKKANNELKLKESVTSAQQRLADFKALFQFLGLNSVPALHRVLANAVQEGWSAKKLLQQCQLAVQGKYTARNYTQYDIDLAILIYELGGAGTLYAMNHSIFALPSRNTIQPYRRQHNIVPSVAEPRRWRSGPQGPDEPILHGHTLSFDELATERRIDYMPATDEMGGFCLEHLDALKTVKIGKDTKTVEEAAEAVREGRVHISHETSVGAISRLSQTNYGAKPVFMGPSCKKGGWRDCLRTMETVVEAWKRSPHGEIKHGPILSVAADGDPRRGAALFVMCMHTEIIPGNPLYPFICNLPGLNRMVGKDNLTKDKDPKHLKKRIRTTFCSPEAVVVKSICINRDMLLKWLERLPDHDWTEASIYALLNPSDAQNVPNTIKLLLCIVALRDLDPEDFDPSEAAEFEAICLLGETLDALLQPFINTELSLSEQIESLIKFSHLICALYLQNGPAFFPNQLYADLQAMFKNAILMVPKTRIINGKLKVFICLLGDDVLEALFGRSRMIGGHSPNCSIGELRDRFGSAMNLDFIYEKHPELERQPRRLNFFRKRHVDHLRPPHWTRELRADSCDLDKCWVRGVKSTEAVLEKYGVQMTMSFSERFKKKDTDLMRPFGGKYPATSTDVDRSMGNYSDIAPVDPTSTNSLHNTDFDAIIASEISRRSPDTLLHSHFAEIDKNGNVRHKKSIVRTLFDMTPDTHSSHDRLQRIHGFTVGGKSWIHEDSPTSDEMSLATHFQLGNLFATLACYNGSHIGLAIAKCTMIKNGPTGSKVTYFNYAGSIGHTINFPESSTKATQTESGQTACRIKAVQAHQRITDNGRQMNRSLTMVTGDHLKSLVLSLTSAEAETVEWAWDGQFISFSLKKKQKSTGEVSRLRNLQVSVSTRLIDPIQEKAREASTFNLQLPPSGREKTWLFSDTVLLESWHTLWNRLIGDKTLHTLFPNFTADTAIQQSLIDRRSCRVCQKPVKETDRQIHVGQHIMMALCGVKDTSAKTPQRFQVSDGYPCGTCGGKSSTGPCKIGITRGKAQSDCPSHYPFPISAAAKFLPTRPYTNIPIKCELKCDEFHWKYNFPNHLEERHPGWRQLITPAFTSQLQITRVEQLALKIPEEKVIEWPAPPPAVAAVPPPNPSIFPHTHSNKRSISSLLSSPSRRDKENEDPRRPPKLMRYN